MNRWLSNLRDDFLLYWDFCMVNIGLRYVLSKKGLVKIRWEY